MCNGDPPPIGFNDMLGIFLPKGAADDDTKSCVKRSAENTRPLGLKNTDNKTVAAVVNRAFTPTSAANACRTVLCFDSR